MLHVFPESIRKGRCRFCRRTVTWAIVAGKPARNGRRAIPAKPLPFNGDPISLERVRDTTTGLEFLTWPEAALHRHTCTARPKPDRTHARDVEASRTGQGRMF